MKRVVFIAIVGLLAVSMTAQNEEARRILDKTSDTFYLNKGIKTEFAINITKGGQPIGSTEGSLQLKGNKFLLQTEEVISWFNGETQWSYLTGSEEVNISNPTEEELQSINPYALLSIYKEGYNIAPYKIQKHNGKSVYNIAMTSDDKKKEITRLVLFIETGTYHLQYIEVELRDGTRNEVTITGYQTGLNLNDSLFSFDHKKYPDAEIIDLR
ncbi:hypothetical protein D0T50_10055 [Bacteroides sp. 214]|uniref:LolA-like putative outer membrane lipoprotein chaperone n=1 Tax=Bacteroides sp. 214 TaxID=2302935 RepID=UPI0013D154AB|nr:LolA-like putative outer membrane lipoprotein chaperone [Bacteroides sp. 214]NDW13237.1 hypothetical protein [Bacteroides sp. 214]